MLTNELAVNSSVLCYKALRRRDTSGKTSGDEEGGADLGKIANLVQCGL